MLQRHGKKQACTPAPPWHTPLLIMMTLEDNYPAVCRRDSPEKAFSRSRLAASLCEQGQWSWERRPAGMQHSAGARAPKGRGRWETFAILASAARITHIPTHASKLYALLFFFLFAAGLFDLCVPGLFAVVIVLLWSKPYYLGWCCSVIHWKRAVEYSSKQLQCWSYNKGINNLSPVYLAWFSGRTGCHFTCNGYGLFPQLLPLLLLSFFMCFCLKQRPERTESFSVAPVVPQWCKCCNSRFQLVTMLLIYTHSCRDGHQRGPTGRSSQRHLIFYELHSVLAVFFSQLLCLICLWYLFWAVRLLFPQCQHWGARWWRGDSNPLGDPRLLLASQSDMVTAGHFLVLLVLVTNWCRNSSQVKKHIWTIYYTLCFSLLLSTTLSLVSPFFYTCSAHFSILRTGWWDYRKECPLWKMQWW